MKILQICTLYLCCMAGISTSVAIAANPVPDSPNILLVIADDMGLDASHCYNIGEQQAPMPTLEALCEKGLVFDNAYAAPVCSPTRANIMSGQYAFQTGVGGAVGRQGNAGGLSGSVTSLFDLLDTTSYSAGLIGKWHIASGADGLDHPVALGVQDYFGLYSGRTNDYSNWQAVENGATMNVNEYATTTFTNRASNWIAEQDTPWFLWLAYNAPHAPFHLPPKDLHSFDSLAEDESSIKKNPLPYYQAMLEALDTELGRLLDSMPSPVRSNTVVIFMGDNGTPNQVSQSLYSDHGAKGTLYEAGINVPMIIAGPGISAGRTDAFVSAIDLYATIASITGASHKSTVAHDFSQVLGGGETTRDFIYAEHFSDRPARGANTYGWSIRQKDMKLLNIDGQPQALYNVEVDPMEKVNLLANNPTAEAIATANELSSKASNLQNN